MKKIKIISLLVILSNAYFSSYSMDLIPTKKEVLDSGLLLNIRLYAPWKNYQKTHPVLQEPKNKTFSDYLKAHVLLQNSWIEEKGFIKELSEARERGISVNEIDEVIKNNKTYRKTQPLTQRLLRISLTIAYDDCVKLCKKN